MTDASLAEQLGVHVKSIAASRRKLERWGYIQTEQSGKGYTVRVRKSKKWMLLQTRRGSESAPSEHDEGATPLHQKERSHSIRGSESAPSGGSLPFNDIAGTKQGHLPVGFEVFWKAYPKKKAKPKAIPAWKKIKAAEIPAIMASIEAYKKTEDWNKNDGQYIPYPATFLNQRRWEDEPTEVNAKTGTHGTDTRRKPNGSEGDNRLARFRGVGKTAKELARHAH